VVRDHFHAYVNYAFDFCGAANWAYIRVFGREADADKVTANNARSVGAADRSAKPGTYAEMIL
jgi:hypothetical protein